MSSRDSCSWRGQGKLLARPFTTSTWGPAPGPRAAAAAAAAATLPYPRCPSRSQSSRRGKVSVRKRAHWLAAAHCRGGVGRSCTRRICCSAPVATLRTRSCAWHCDQQCRGRAVTCVPPNLQTLPLRSGQRRSRQPTSMFAQRMVTTNSIVSARPPFPIPAARATTSRCRRRAPVFLIDDELSPLPSPLSGHLASEHRCRCQGRRFTEGFTQRKRQGQSRSCRQPCGTQHAKYSARGVLRNPGVLGRGPWGLALSLHGEWRAV